MTDQTAATPAPQPEGKQATDQHQTKVKSAAQPPKRRHKFVRWAHKRRRLLTFIGGLIVFGTFIVKDALRENLKDFVDAVDRAESVFLIRIDIYGTQPWTVDAIDPPNRGQNPSKTPPPDFKKLEPAFQAIFKEKSTAAILIDNNGRLSDVLDDTDFQQGYEAEKQWLDQTGNDLGQLQDAVRGSFNPESGEFFFDSFDKAARLEWSLWQRIQGERIVLDNSREGILELARKSKATHERRYTIATWASYLLYAFGWSLGLVGRLVGVDTGAGA